MWISSYKVPVVLFTRFSVAFLRHDLVDISRWAAETRPCGPDALKGLIEDLHKEVLRILEVPSLPSELFPRMNYFSPVRHDV